MTGIPSQWTAALACMTACCFLLASTSCADEKDDQSFNAVDGVTHELMVAVGNKGLIVHFPAGEAPRRMPSGTDRDLLGVHVVARDYAVAVGHAVVLLWDGAAWEPIVTAESSALFSEVWASQDRHMVLYGGIDGDAQRICPWIPNAGPQPFCRRFLTAMRGACGNGEHIYLLLANGDIHLLNDALMDADGNFEPAFSPLEPLDLAAAWLPEETCQPSVGLLQVLAVAWDGSLLHFDGARWRVVRDTVPTIALAQKDPLPDLHDEKQQ